MNISFMTLPEPEQTGLVLHIVRKYKSFSCYERACVANETLAQNALTREDFAKLCDEYKKKGLAFYVTYHIEPFLTKWRDLYLANK